MGLPPPLTPPEPFPQLRRVAVVGTSCCGKTTFARALSIALGAPHVELDALYWMPAWQERPEPEFRALVAQRVAADRWVADGNYGFVRDLVWARATDVVWLDYSFPRVFSRAVARTLRRAVTREELFSGNRESIRHSFFSRHSIPLWVLTTFRHNRRKYAALQSDQQWSHLRFQILRRPAHALAFLSGCRAAAAKES